MHQKPAFLPPVGMRGHMVKVGIVPGTSPAPQRAHTHTDTDEIGKAAREPTCSAQVRSDELGEPTGHQHTHFCGQDPFKLFPSLLTDSIIALHSFMARKPRMQLPQNTF